MTNSDRAKIKRGPKMGPDASRKITRRRTAGVRDPIDVHVGNRVRARRTMLGLSQSKLGEAVGLTFQQIQKYEQGANRMGGSRLYDMAYVLDVPVDYFFDEMPNEIKKRDDKPSDNLGDQIAEANKGDASTKRETLELVRAYYKVGGEDVRKNLLKMIQSLS
jgi:transcriptional regulator with XRE-family HTH domain